MSTWITFNLNAGDLLKSCEKKSKLKSIPKGDFDNTQCACLVHRRKMTTIQHLVKALKAQEAFYSTMLFLHFNGQRIVLISTQLKTLGGRRKKSFD